MSRVLDCFCGAGGASEGLRRAGFDVVGIEKDKDAATTHEAAGHATIRADITTLDPLALAAQYGPFDGLWMSPPCQDFSLAGLRAGIEGERGRLVLEVLRWSKALRPRFIACEQVPPVLEIWRWFAHELRQIGYTTWTGVLSAERYGVPQTRQRAILVARQDGVAAIPPRPTHTAYDYRLADNGRYSGAGGLFGADELPWVSMADALDFGMTERPGLTFAPGTTAGGQDLVGGSGARRVLNGERERGAWRVATGNNSMTTGRTDADREGGERQFKRDAVRVTVAQAAVLQGFPPDYPWQGSNTSRYRQIGNAVPPPVAEAIGRSLSSATLERTA